MLQVYLDYVAPFSEPPMFLHCWPPPLPFLNDQAHSVHFLFCGLSFLYTLLILLRKNKENKNSKHQPNRFENHRSVQRRSGLCEVIENDSKKDQEAENSHHLVTRGRPHQLPDTLHMLFKRLDSSSVDFMAEDLGCAHSEATLG